MDRILLLMESETFRLAEKALCSARDNAASPLRLSFGLSLTTEPDGAEQAAMHSLGSVQFMCPGEGSWRDAEALWQGEGFILTVHPDMRFTQQWDIHLLRALRQCGRGGDFKVVLTGFLPRRQDPVDAVAPVAACGFERDGQLSFHRGTPLRYARTPLRGAFIHPGFCFAPAAFFREMLGENGPLFLAAFRNKWRVYTLHKPLMHLENDMPLAPCTVQPDGETGSLNRFEQHFSLRFAERKLSAMARQGVWTMDLTFPLHVPLAVRAQEVLRETFRRRSRVSPLCVTAFQKLAEAGENLPEQHMCWFGYLSRLKNMALLCYADGEMIRRLSVQHPNMLEYKRRYALPVQTDAATEKTLNFFRLSKLFLLAQSREKFLHHTHYIWMDFGYLRYPVYERAALDWDIVCQDKIMLAVVNGAPDTSMVVVPDARLLILCREITAICETALGENGVLPDEGNVWRKLIHDHGDWFQLVDMPAPRELLTMTMMSREEEAHVYA